MDLSTAVLFYQTNPPVRQTRPTGVMAIAAAIEVLGQRRAFNFDVNMVRKHLATCLQRHHTVPNFCKLLSPATEGVHDVVCSCRDSWLLRCKSVSGESSPATESVSSVTIAVNVNNGAAKRDENLCNRSRNVMH